MDKLLVVKETSTVMLICELGIGENTVLQGRMVHFHLQSGLAHRPVVSACEAVMNIEVFLKGLAFLD
jgi:hypothetical protein